MTTRPWARRSREAALEMARSFDGSGMSQGEFAERMGISTRTLDHYRRRAREQGRTELVELEVAPAVGWPQTSGLALAPARSCVDPPEFRLRVGDYRVRSEIVILTVKHRK